MQVLGWNLSCENRISAERLEHFFEVTGQPSTATALQRAVIDYHRDWVCERPHESYLSRTRNSGNFVVSRRLPRDLMLVTVMNVSAWVQRLRTLPAVGVRLERGLTAVSNGEADGDELEEFLARLLSAINDQQAGRPTWVVRSDAFDEAIAGRPPAAWSQAVGVWRIDGTWQVVLRYPASAVDQLVRPCQLESGYNQYHFPSPRRLACTYGGFAMALFDRAQILISEWIHAPIELRVEYWRAGGALCAAIRGSPIEPIWFYRTRHRELLSKAHPYASRGWLPQR